MVALIMVTGKEPKRRKCGKISSFMKNFNLKSKSYLSILSNEWAGVK